MDGTCGIGSDRDGGDQIRAGGGKVGKPGGFANDPQGTLFVVSQAIERNLFVPTGTKAKLVPLSLSLLVPSPD